jgi:hypothetical protein
MRVARCAGFLRTGVIYAAVSNHSTIARRRSPAKVYHLHHHMLPLLPCHTIHHHLRLVSVWLSSSTPLWRFRGWDGCCCAVDSKFGPQWLGPGRFAASLYFPFPFGLVSVNSAMGSSLLSPSATSPQTTMPSLLNSAQVFVGVGINQL